MYKKHQKYQKHWERVPLPCNNKKTKQINQRNITRTAGKN